MKLIFVLSSITALVFLSACGDSVPCVDLNNVDATLVCNNAYDPVCGCDNTTYPNQCFAERAGVVSWIGGPCP